MRPLTEYNAKPAVPFGGKYKIIDFVLSNCLHSKLRKIYVLPQYEPFSLHDHLDSWSSIFNSEMGEYLKEILDIYFIMEGNILYYVMQLKAVITVLQDQ